jgi:hypothetical protein
VQIQFEHIDQQNDQYIGTGWWNSAIQHIDAAHPSNTNSVQHIDAAHTVQHIHQLSIQFSTSINTDAVFKSLIGWLRADTKARVTLTGHIWPFRTYLRATYCILVCVNITQHLSLPLYYFTLQIDPYTCL